MSHVLSPKLNALAFEMFLSFQQFVCEQVGGIF